MFSSKSLNDALEKTKASLENYSQNVIQISQDIKSLEELLQNYGINLPFAHVAICEIVDTDIPPTAAESGCYTEHHSIEQIAWEKSTKEKDEPFRLFYKKFTQMVEKNIDFFPIEGELIQVDSRPLVETPVPIRLRMYPQLSIFLEKLARRLPPVTKEGNLEKSTEKFKKQREKEAGHESSFDF